VTGKHKLAVWSIDLHQPEVFGCSRENIPDNLVRKDTTDVSMNPFAN